MKAARYRKGVSQRRLGSKFGIPKESVLNILADAHVKYYKKKVCPKYAPGQAERAKKACGDLQRDFFPASGNVEIIQDDESYFPMKMDTIPGNAGFYGDGDTGSSSAPDEIRFSGKFKFPTRLMMWVAIFSRGVSEPYFCPTKQALNGKLYLEECIEKRLKPFLDEFHADSNFIFWPDLASCHYAKDTQSLLDDLEIPFVPKEEKST